MEEKYRIKVKDEYIPIVSFDTFEEAEEFASSWHQVYNKLDPETIEFIKRNLYELYTIEK